MYQLYSVIGTVLPADDNSATTKTWTAENVVDQKVSFFFFFFFFTVDACDAWTERLLKHRSVSMSYSKNVTFMDFLFT